MTGPGVLTRALSGIALVSLLAIGLPQGSAPAAADETSERLVRTRTSLLGTHTWYQQTYRDVDVLDGVVGIHAYRGGGTSKVDGRKSVADAPPVAPTVTAAQARATAGPQAGDALLAIKAGSPSRLVWAVTSVGPSGATRTLVDARDGMVLEVKRIQHDADGRGTVFDPNPVVTLKDQTLTDAGDANLPVFGPSYRSVPLRHLDGSGYLRGDYAVVSPLTEPPAFSPSLVFDTDRSSPAFEQAMAYFHVTTSQEYIQSLGFVDANNRPTRVVPDGTSDDASFAVPDAVGTTLYFGTGGVDDAEDADIIWHEYGHAILADQVFGFPWSADAAAIGEGFGDYWAVTMSQPVNGGYDVPCVAEWNSLGLATPRPCLRRVDSSLTVAGRIGEPHFDGQIWSRALWDINQRLGRDAANALILEAQFAYAPETTFGDAAAVTVETARRLLGSAAASIVRKAFADRGISSNTKRVGAKASETKAPPALQEMARLGGPAPGGNSHQDLFEPYDLNDKGEALYASNLSSGGQGLFAGDKASAREFARSGDPAPSGDSFGFGVVAGPGIDRDGDAAFAYYLSDQFEFPVGRDAGVYRSGPGGPRAIVVPGQTPAPGGGVFLGAGESTSTNDHGAVAFTGMIPTPHGIADGVGMGVFLGSADGSIQPLIVPGTAAPGGSTFDYAGLPSINGAGDVAFVGHVAGTPCETGTPQWLVIGCHSDSLFVRRAGSGQVERLVTRGADAPGGGTFIDVVNPVLSDNGDVVLVGVVLTDRGFFPGVFGVHGGQVTRMAGEGDPMPGGGAFAATGFVPGNADINDRGDIAFSATLDTDDDGDGLLDQGLYRWISGKLTVVVRTGVLLPAGRVISMQPLAGLGSYYPASGAAINHARRVLWQATVVDGEGHLETVLYTSG